MKQYIFFTSSRIMISGSACDAQVGGVAGIGCHANTVMLTAGGQAAYESMLNFPEISCPGGNSPIREDFFQLQMPMGKERVETECLTNIVINVFHASQDCQNIESPCKFFLIAIEINKIMLNIYLSREASLKSMLIISSLTTGPQINSLICKSNGDKGRSTKFPMLILLIHC